jgi:hypothetical protein
MGCARHATIEAENGASGAKLDALFGWRTGSKTSAIYIHKADRRGSRLAPSRNRFRTSASSPRKKVRPEAQKSVSSQVLIFQLVGEVGLEPTKA